MKKFLKYLILLWIPLLIVMAVNIFIDSKSYFSSRYADHLAEEINKNPVAIHTEPEFRLVIKHLIELNNGRHFGKIVLGSSRAMQIGSPIGENVLNISVSGVVLEDYEKLISLLNENSISFDTLTVSAHGWIFNKNHGDLRYKIYEKGVGFDSIKKAFSWEYLFDNLSHGKYKVWDGNDKDFVVNPDGTIRYDIKFRTQVPDVKHHVEQALKWPFADYYRLDPDYINRFEKLFQEISKNHIVELVLLPYHPEVYNELITKIPMVIKAEEYYNSIMINKSFNTNNILVKGSYNPEKLGLEAQDFYDPNHLNEGGLMKLYRNR